MRTTESSSRTTPASASSERRTRGRLRDLCDEVIASYRLASQGDPFSEQDRVEGRALLLQVAATK
jgi:hypothetical protein